MLILSLAVFASSAHGQGMAKPGGLNPPMRAPVTSRPQSTAGPAGTSSDRTDTQGVMIDVDSNLGRGIYAELSQSYREKPFDQDHRETK